MLQVGELLEALLPHLGVQASGQHAIIPGPSTGRRRQISIGGGGSPDPFASTMGGAPVRVSSSGMAMTMAGPGDVRDSKDGDRESKVSIRDSKDGDHASRVSVRDSKDGLRDSKDGLRDSKDGLRDSKDGDLQIELISGSQPVSALPAMPASRSRLPVILGGVLVLALGIGVLTLRGKPNAPHTGVKDPDTLAIPTPPPPPPPVLPPPDKAKPAADLPTSATKAETDGEETPDERTGANKGKGKKSRSRSGKKLRAEEIEPVAGKKIQPHTGHGPTDGEADVWR
jgi:hypothetical protein